MSSNHPEMMWSYPNPMLDYMPEAAKYAKAKAMLSVNRSCPGLHYPDVLAPWGVSESSDGLAADAGLMSNGPYSTMPIVWLWEYGDRENKTEILERYFPLVKGETDFFSCFLTLNASDGYLHDLHDCTNESPGLCPSSDTVMTLSMMRRCFDVVSDMAAFVGAPVDPKWAATLAKVVPDPVIWFHVDTRFWSYRMGNVSHECGFCSGARGPPKGHRPPTAGDCQATSQNGGNMQGDVCARSVSGACPKGMGPCSQQGYAAVGNTGNGHPGAISGGNSQSCFPVFPADAVGTNSSASGAGAATVIDAEMWAQGNSFTKAYSAAARVVAPGLLNASMVYQNWKSTFTAQSQPNGIPMNPFSGFETVGATEYVNYMHLQSDPAGFLGLFEAMPAGMSASFTRLRGRGAFIVSSSITKGVVGGTTLVSNRGETCVIRRPQSWSKAAVKVVAEGSPVEVRWEGAADAEFFSFLTTKGQTYTLTGV